MAKRKKKPTTSIDELVSLAKSLNMIEDALDGDVKDAAESAAELEAESANNTGVRRQIEFLLDNGFAAARIEELIREYAMNPDA